MKDKTTGKKLFKCMSSMSLFHEGSMGRTDLANYSAKLRGKGRPKKKRTAAGKEQDSRGRSEPLIYKSIGYIC